MGAIWDALGVNYARKYTPGTMVVVVARAVVEVVVTVAVVDVEVVTGVAATTHEQALLYRTLLLHIAVA